MHSRILRLTCVVFACVAVQNYALALEFERDSQNEDRGKSLYVSLCASCHGDIGEGVSGGYTTPLVGDATIGELAKIIHDTMPEGEPELCVDEDAAEVAKYIFDAFYSPEAQNRLNPPKQTLSRLTANQLRQSVADLYAHHAGAAWLVPERGLIGRYFAAEHYSKDHMKLERIDPYIDFDFARESPVEGVSPDSYYIYWEGSLLPERTGRYEIVVHSSVSFRLNLGSLDRSLIDNHVQSGDKTEFRQSIYLAAGRPYPFKIDLTQRNRKTEIPPAQFKLAWVPPGGVEETIPTRYLLPIATPAAYSLQAFLPPDDRSYGFERGVAINKQWDESTTAAALEFADVAARELYPKYRRDKRDAPNQNREVLKSFLRDTLRVAFRQEIDDELFDAYIDRQLQQAEDDTEAIKRVLLIGLKSPRFLYPLADSMSTRSQRVANRLTLTLYDSLPSDKWILEEIQNNRLESEDSVRQAAYRLVQDYRAQAKIRQMIHEWLNLTHQSELTKSIREFPDFDAALVQDLKSSLDAQINEIVFEGSSDFRQFFLADWAYSTPRIAEFYQKGWSSPELQRHAMTKVSLKEDHRFGILTHPLMLSGLAYHDATSPIHRGVFLLRYILGRTLRPPNEAFSPLSPDLHPDLSTRERVALQTSSDNCQICHIKINPLGFALEEFDAVGRFRTDENGKSIDPTGNYRSRDDHFVEFHNGVDLTNYLAGSPDAHRAFVNRSFQYLVKQPPDAFGPDTLKSLTQKFTESRYNIKELIVEIAVIASRPSDLQ